MTIGGSVDDYVRRDVSSVAIRLCDYRVNVTNGDRR